MIRPTLLACLVLLAALAAGCRGPTGSKAEDAGPDRSRLWTVKETARDGVDLLVRGAKVDDLKGNLDAILAELNRVTMLEWGRGADQHPGPPVLVLRELRNGVAHVEVVDGEFLTQKMGTTGAHYYLTAATYSLTEAPGVHAVDFQFEEGDHAAPGVFMRESFQDVRIVR